LLGAVGRLSRTQKQYILLVIDSVLAPLSLLVAMLIVEPGLLSSDLLVTFMPGALLVTAVAVVGSVVLGMHRIQLKSYEAIAAMKSGLIALLCGAAVFGIWKAGGIALTAAGIVLFVLIFTLSAIVARFMMHQVLLGILSLGQVRQNVIIYGAGSTGAQLASALRSDEKVRVVAFIDDNPNLRGLTVQGLRVRDSSQLDRLVAQHDVHRILLAIPSAPPARQATLTRSLLARGLEVQALPSFAQLVGTETIADTLHSVAPGDFLGRAPVDGLEPEADLAYHGKSVLVTGAGGSVGSELCRQLLRYRPARIVLFEVSELALYTIQNDLISRPGAEGIEIVPVLGSVTESRLIRAVCGQNAVNVVLHAAAYKHVPLVEANPVAGIVNNVFGTRTTAEAAMDMGVERFIMISTDKAVRPTNVMGATKRMAELVVQDLAQRSDGTDFTIVRFGNVLGSSGSVIPLFKAQIARGGPITLTHEDVTRYFMTIEEAANLVLIAGSLPKSRDDYQGDLLVLDMGEPIRIRDLARRMIAAAGLEERSAENPGGDIEISVIGLRPGEKLHEELLIEPGMLTTPHEKILRARERALPASVMAEVLRDLRGAVSVGDAEAARAIMEQHVEGFAAAQPAARRATAAE
jgi:FlaA1/EpsC-like NDP-sugar epimerase